MTNSSTLRDHGDGLWTLDGGNVRMFGIPFGTRMTIVRLGGGGIWLHSPIVPSDEICEVVAGLGPVEHIVAPGTLHHLYVAPWRERFPDAQPWAEASLIRRFGDDKVGRLLDADADPWPDDFVYHRFEGSKVMSELVFCHRPSRSLIVTDIIQNHDPARESWFWRAVKRVNGILAPRGGVPRDWRLSVRDKDAARASTEAILDWDFDRIIISHGLNIDSDGHAYFEHAFAPFLKS